MSNPENKPLPKLPKLPEISIKDKIVVELERIRDTLSSTSRSYAVQLINKVIYEVRQDRMICLVCGTTILGADVRSKESRICSHCNKMINCLKEFKVFLSLVRNKQYNDTDFNLDQVIKLFETYQFGDFQDRIDRDIYNLSGP